MIQPRANGVNWRRCQSVDLISIWLLWKIICMPLAVAAAIATPPPAVTKQKATAQMYHIAPLNGMTRLSTNGHRWQPWTSVAARLHRLCAMTAYTCSVASTMIWLLIRPPTSWSVTMSIRTNGRWFDTNYSFYHYQLCCGQPRAALLPYCCYPNRLPFVFRFVFLHHQGGANDIGTVWPLCNGCHRWICRCRRWWWNVQASHPLCRKIWCNE